MKVEVDVYIEEGMKYISSPSVVLDDNYSLEVPRVDCAGGVRLSELPKLTQSRTFEYRLQSFRQAVMRKGSTNVEVIRSGCPSITQDLAL